MIARLAQSFDRLLSESIERMHREMMFSPSGDQDRDFARMMIRIMRVQLRWRRLS